MKLSLSALVIGANKDNMHYFLYRKRRLLVESGTAEYAVKQTGDNRFKQAGCPLVDSGRQCLTCLLLLH